MATEPKAGRKITKFKQLKLKTAPSSRVDSNSIAAVPLTVQAVLGQTGDLVQFTDSNDVVIAKINAAGQLVMVAQASLPDPFGLGGSIKMARMKYSFAVDGGAQGLITPGAAFNSVIPDNAIILGGMLNPTTAPVGVSATLAFGTSAGSAANSLKAATAITSFTLDALVALVPLWTAATAFKMTAAGSLTMTIATTDLSAGVIELTVFYYVAAA